MEIRANYVLVGVFALAMIVAAVAYAIWATQSSSREEMIRYSIEFSGDVSGLQVGSPVSFNGIRVGSIKRLRIAPYDSSKVDVLIEVQESVPIRTDSEASLEIRSITGQATIMISSGNPSNPLLTQVSDITPPMIPSRNSGLQQAFQTLPEILSEAKVTLVNLNSFLSEENRQNFTEIMANMKDVSNSAKSSGEKLDRLLSDLEVTSKNVNLMMVDLQKSARTIDQTVSQAGPGIARFSTDGLDEFRRLLVDTRDLVNNLSRMTNKMESEPRQFLFGSQIQEYEGK